MRPNNLRDYLARLYPNRSKIVVIAADGGINEEYLATGGDACYIWHELLGYCTSHSLLHNLVEKVTLEFGNLAKELAHLTEEWRKKPLPLPTRPPAHKPIHLPYASLGSLFKGREDFLNNLRTQLHAQAAAVIRGRQAIHGMGGVGKTRAAIEYAWKYAEDYTALLCVTADSPEALQRNIAGLCGPQALNLPEQSATDQSLQYHAALLWLKQHPGWFLILDNVDTKEAAAAVESLLRDLSAGHVVITSRIADWSGQVHSLDLDVLSEDAAVEFLMERTAGRRTPAPDDAAACRELAGLLDCLALALEQAAAYIREQRLSFAAYIRRWKSVTAEAIAWHDAVKMQYPQSLAITYETSLGQLTEQARELFSILSWVAPDPMPLTALESPKLPDGSRARLMELENLHLVRFQQDGAGFSVHRLVQEITRQKQTDPLPPPALMAALTWIDDLFPTEADNVRYWPLLDIIASHGQSVALFAVDHAIPFPTTRLMNQVALLQNAKSQHDVAESLYRRALAIAEVSYGHNHPEVAIYLNNLSGLLHTTNRLKEAEPLMRRALAIDEANYGKDHPKVAIDLNILAGLLKDTNRLIEAEPLMRRALSIDEASYGMNHPRFAIDLDNLAGLFKDTNRMEEAEQLVRRALAIDEANYDKDHPKVGIRLTHLGNLLHSKNQLKEAELVMRRALAINEASYGKDHPKVAVCLTNLGGLLHGMKRLVEAEPLMRRALAIDEAIYGMDHPNVAVDLNNLAQLLQVTNRLTEAEPLMRRALAIDEASYGPDHPDVATTLNNLARLLKASNRLDEADPLMWRMLLILLKFTQQMGHSHPNLGSALNNYAVLIQALEGDQYVWPTLFSLGTEAGLPSEQFQEILNQAFGR